MEQSASFRFGIYLYDAIKEIDWINNLHLDMEYNRNKLAPKITPRYPKGTRPDLIIHLRESNSKNMLMVEIKGWWNKTPRKRDREKLEDFTNQNGEYKYALGVFLDFKKDSCKPEYFIDGKSQSLKNKNPNKINQYVYWNS